MLNNAGKAQHMGN